MQRWQTHTVHWRIYVIPWQQLRAAAAAATAETVGVRYFDQIVGSRQQRHLSIESWPAAVTGEPSERDRFSAVEERVVLLSSSLQ